MDKNSTYEIRSLITSLHKRENLDLVEKLAKIVEKMNNELIELKGTKDSSKELELLRHEISNAKRETLNMKQRIERLEQKRL